LPPRDNPHQDNPTATFTTDQRQQVIVTVNATAAAWQITPGMPLAQARAILPDLAVLPADPVGDAAALRRLGIVLQRFTPLVGMVGDGLALDITGCASLWNGEEGIYGRIAETFSAFGIAACLAMADTHGAAWALARFGTCGIAPIGTVETTIAGLPLAALRLPLGLPRALRRLGFVTVGDLYGMPRATLTRRFGPDLALRLDQALGHALEPLMFLPEPEPLARTLTFLEPIGRPEDMAHALYDGLALVVADLEAGQLGARRVTAAYVRVDGRIQTLTIGTAAPNRDPRHLERLFAEKIPTIDPGLGIESVTVAVPMAEPLPPRQTTALVEADGGHRNLAPLIDRLVNRLGADAVYGLAPRESDLPERAVGRISPLHDVPHDWPHHWPRPLRLLSPPEPVETMALLPDYPPAQFIWRKVRRRVAAADGPERMFGEWWRRREEAEEIRDYYRVEDETGERFWLFRRRLGAETRWYVHGIFA